MRIMHATRSGSGRRPQTTSSRRCRNPGKLHLRDFSGSKSARKAEAGALTMRAPGGVVSQLCRELQQRNFKQGASK